MSTNIDRQQLLEQKRQRLIELKQRKLLSQSQSPSPTGIVPPPNHDVSIKKSVDVSTQTDEEPTFSETTHTKIEREIDRYDKAVQTVDLVEIESATVEEKNEVQLTDKQLISEDELNQTLVSSIKLINKLHVTNTINLSNQTTTANETDSKYSGIRKLSTFDTKRSIKEINVDSEFLIVIFHKTTSNSTDAIIYNTSSLEFFPEYHLSSLSQIEILQFDKYKKNRVIAGFANGGIGIWELKDNDVSLMPSLSTPLFSSNVGSNLHSDKIVYLSQILLDGNPCILSISQDCVINIWSTSLLVEPKSSFRIFGNEANSLQITNAIYVGSDEVVGTDFISDILISTNDGNLYNGKGELVHENSDSVISAITTLDDYTVTGHSDWNLKLWRANTTPVKEIPTAFIVRNLEARPGKHLQFVVLGSSNITNGKYKVELWDLEKKLYSSSRR
ncbi:hypothetical protein G210_0132 [Candida maltosa Xu316]|uniref:Uncharacterized protein n=1 Tax=Candida maltosa (strain Xu316) TaxID=1245528 RepID=M3IRN3_CANMX|nr:hypothetical protein G210_0132 [Candida maltosa Xu316]